MALRSLHLGRWGNGPLDRSLGQGTWTTARGGAKLSLPDGQGHAWQSLRPSRASPEKFRCPVRTKERTQERMPGPRQREPVVSLKLCSPLAPAPTPIAQALGDPACTRKKESKPHRPSCLLLCPQLYPPAPTRGSRRTLWASQGCPQALACPEQAKGTSWLRMSTQWRGWGAVYICLAVV